MSVQLIIDPPSGWQFGFPRPVPDDYFMSGFDLNNWLISQGYPQSIIDQFPDGLPCRFWEEDI